ncbi:MAG: Adenine deaminase [Gemmatimonadaceae bacterium]|nr:Adenine deaminase [Gemmatimonadaceae bacterium]
MHHVLRTTVLYLLLAPGAFAQERPSLSPAARAYVEIDAPVIALTHARLVDGTGAPVRENQTIVIDGTRIAAVGAGGQVAIPPGARVIDLTGHTVTPGFVGLHEHTYFSATTRTTQMAVSGPLLYLGNGVTTMRTAGSQFPYEELNMKRAVERGDLPGPRMHITGPYLNGAGSGGRSRGLATPDEARRVVAYWGEEGATWLKFSGSITRDVMRAAIDEAHKHGMRATGHLCSVTFSEAAALGIDALEHGFITNSAYVPGKQPDVCPGDNMRIQADVDVKSPAVQASIRELAAKGVALTSTLAVYETFVPERAKLNPRAMEMLAPDTRREVEETHATIARGGLVVPVRLIRKMMQWEYDFVQAGGLLGAGVDPWGTGMLPGFGDLRNYELLVEAGFAPPQAFRIMSLNGAKILGEDRLTGSVEPGKRADLVVIRGDPVSTPADVYNVVTVFKDGYGYSTERLLDGARGLVGIR